MTRHNGSCKHFSSAFTLAEVLITLGIIGIVAALTIPTLIQTYTNNVVETRLKKVYSVMNQAILRSEEDNGPKESWDFTEADFIEKYFSPYLNKVEVKDIETENYDYKGIYFTDGSLLLTKSSFYKVLNINYGLYQDYYFYPNAKSFKLEEFEKRKNLAISYFLFRFVPTHNEIRIGMGFQPYFFNMPSDTIVTEELLTKPSLYSCSEDGYSSVPGYCTALIWFNGWKIPKNYPFKVKL